MSIQELLKPQQQGTLRLCHWRSENGMRLWFEDGSVILATPKVLFRVYRGTLARHSPIFRDLFSLPQPAVGSDEDLMEGLPVVNLQDDPEELAHLLNALNDRSYYTHTTVTSFSIVKAILILSTKYHIESLRIQAISHLSPDFPDTLEALDRRTIEGLKVTQVKHSDLIRVGHLTDVMVLLPYTSYLFATNFQRMEETPEKACENLKNLSREDVMRVYVGREKLRHALIEDVGKFLYEPSPAGCSSPDCIGHKTMFLTSPFWRDWVRKGTIFSPKHCTVFMTLQEKLCSVCKAAFVLSVDQGRRNAWNKLPRYFGLQDWVALRAVTPDFVAGAL